MLVTASALVAVLIATLASGIMVSTLREHWPDVLALRIRHERSERDYQVVWRIFEAVPQASGAIRDVFPEAARFDHRAKQALSQAEPSGRLAA